MGGRRLSLETPGTLDTHGRETRHRIHSLHPALAPRRPNVLYVAQLGVRLPRHTPLARQQRHWRCIRAGTPYCSASSPRSSHSPNPHPNNSPPRTPQNSPFFSDYRHARSRSHKRACEEVGDRRPVQSAPGHDPRRCSLLARTPLLH